MSKPLVTPSAKVVGGNIVKTSGGYFVQLEFVEANLFPPTTATLEAFFPDEAVDSLTNGAFGFDPALAR